MITLDALGIVSIDLTPAGDAQTFADGSTIHGTSTFQRGDGTTGTAGDVALVHEVDQASADGIEGRPIRIGDALRAALAADSFVFGQDWQAAPEQGDPIEFGDTFWAQPDHCPNQLVSDIVAPIELPLGAMLKDAVLANWQQDDFRHH